MELNQISQEEVRLLKPVELVELLEILISAEVSNHFVPKEITSISVPRPITIKDGGEDAHVNLDVADETNITSLYIKAAFTCFQSKAQKMNESDCRNEIDADPKKRKNKTLKPRVQACFDKDGEYILFTTDSLTAQAISNRIDAMREVLKKCKVTDPDNKKIRIFDANQIAAWVNNYVSAVIFVQKCRGISRLQDFMTWAEWQQLFNTEKKYDFQQTPYITGQILKLNTYVKSDKVIRVVGHKGLGKTRLVLEAFNPFSDDDEIKNFSQSLVYIDLARSTPESLSSFILAHRYLEGTIIADNCTDEWHNHYAPLIKSSGNLKLITINDSNPINTCPCIYLTRKEQKDTVSLIFKNCFVGLSDAQVEHLVTISEGFPEMVSYIDNVLRENSAELVYSTIPSAFINKFLFAGKNDDDEYQLFKACAIFTNFLFYDDKDDDLLNTQEKDKIANQNALIHGKITKRPVNENAFYAFCVKYRDSRSLLEKHGLKYSVIPEPIAVNLAAEWWNETPFRYVESLMSELEQNELLVPMIDRLMMLDQSERARGVVAKAWGPNGPFVTAEVLNTQLGSRLFRSVVEVNPEPTMAALTQAFENYSIKDLKDKLVIGRRNLVWALEKLVFRSETFMEASQFLARLAAAENENYGNNATGQLRQLMHIFLPGTSANLDERLKLIDWCSAQPEPELQEMSVRLMASGLMAHGFTRTGGAETQGFGITLVEYKPDTWNEIFIYWDSIIEKLVSIATSNPSMLTVVKQILASSIRDQFSSGRSEIISNAIIAINQVDNTLWNEALVSLTQTAQYESLSDDDINLIQRLKQLLSPITLEDKFRLLVDTPPWEYEAENYDRDLSQNKAEAFARDLIDRDIDLTPYISFLVTGEQRQAYNFGRVFGAESKNASNVIAATINELKQLPRNSQNISFLAGVLSKLNRDRQKQVIHIVINSDGLSHQAFQLVRMIGPKSEDFEQLFELIDNGSMNIREFEALQYGRPFEQMTPAEVCALCERIARYGIDGAWTAFLLLFQYTWSNKELWTACSETQKNILLSHNFIAIDYGIITFEDYKWTNELERHLNNTADNEFALKISEQLAQAALNGKHFIAKNGITNLVKILCEQYFSEFFSVVAPLIPMDNAAFFYLKGLIGASNGAWGHNGFFFEDHQEKIIEFCRNSGNKAQRRVAYMMPLFKNKEWHPFALEMINAFGEDDKVLDEIAANMGSFSIVGSSEGYYNNIINLAKELYSHPISKVRSWAKKCVQYYEKAIRRERLEEDGRL
ncbi:hypothetical protein [Mucilaginibacter sp. R-33]|uniref:hypothetical protein n=1 Tax=Mucilaginibacter sp. R-33 TaxID=3416711 RepID=UPI003CE9BA06